MAATIFRYDNAGNSLGTLPYDTATHDEALDGTDKLSVVSEISPTKRDRLVWQDDGGAWHEHLVDSAKRTHADKGARTESLCSNSISELYGVIAAGTRIRAKVQEIMSTLLSGTRWTVGTCDDFGVVEIEVYHKSVRECIAELCELCKGELETAVTVGDSGVVQRVARIVKERGNKAVVRQFQYGRNVSSILREVASEEVYTAVKGYGAKLQEDDDSEFPARLEVLAESGMDLTRWGVPLPDGTFAHNFTTYTDAQCTDRQFLLRQCRSVLASVSKPLVRYEFDTADAGNGLWSDVRLGDRVMCVDELFNQPLELTERVSQIRRNLRGRIQCRIAIGARANPILEQFRAAEKVSRVSTGNPSRISSHTPIRTGGAGYDGEGAPSIGDITPIDPTVPIEPSSIAVTKAPDKTDYYDGESIDFSGIVVTLYNSDGSVYTDEWHPDGMAAFGELDFEPTMASMADGESGSMVTNGDGLVCLKLDTSKAGVGISSIWGTDWLSYDDTTPIGYREKTGQSGELYGPVCLCDKDKGNTHVYYLTVYDGIVHATRDDGYVGSDFANGAVYPDMIEDRAQFYWGFGGITGSEHSGVWQYGAAVSERTSSVPESTADPKMFDNISWIPVQVDVPVTVTWTRKDGKALEATMTMKVSHNPFDSGATWGGGGEDQFSSSGGGKF